MQTDAGAQRARRAHRVDHLLIAEMVAPGSRVLDVGCGDGALLQLLAETKNVDGRGVELSRERVNACVARGLSVIQGDADRDLADYPDQAFDYAILSLTIQATRQPKTVLENLLRIGRQRHRLVPELRPLAHARRSCCFTGRMPMTENLPEAWYASPNAHLCTIKDFADLVALVERRGRGGRGLQHLRHSGCRSSAPSRCRTCSARKPCSCCASPTPPRTAGPHYCAVSPYPNVSGGFLTPPGAVTMVRRVDKTRR